jgi:hypothetical protein
MTAPGYHDPAQGPLRAAEEHYYLSRALPLLREAAGYLRRVPGVPTLTGDLVVWAVERVEGWMEGRAVEDAS